MNDHDQDNKRQLLQPRGQLSRREMIQRLTALGLTLPLATSLVAARGRKASAQGKLKISFANVLETGELFVQLGNGI